VSVTTAGGTSTSGSADRFTYAGGPPEYGRCIKVAAGSGIYGDSGCTTAGGEKKYEWYPAFGGSRPLVKAHFTSKTKLTGLVTLETPKKTKVTCKGQTGAGEYTARNAVGNVLDKFTGCEGLGQKCSTAGSAEGEIATRLLEGGLGVILQSKEGPAKNKIGLDLKAVGGGLIAEFACGASVFKVRGSVIVPLPSNKMLSGEVLGYTATKGVQKPSHFEHEANDLLEASIAGGAFELDGLTLTSIQTNAEAVEVNTVV
jgi:hypothetical protein